jgi:glucan 1,3-beta-glucosidase
MYIRSLLSLPLFLGALSHAVALPAIDSTAGLASRASSRKLGRQSCEGPGPAEDGPEFWLESIAKQGVSPLGPSGYAVFRNVKDFGAKGEWADSLLRLRFSCTDSETI